jgi:hypothetical protein
MASLRTTGLALAVLLGAGTAAGQASAMPAAGLATAASQVADGIQDVGWYCGPYRCWSAPRRYWGYAPGRYWHRGWGWRHRW